MKVWNIPATYTYTYLQDMLAQPHLLIAGATGSGKSVLLNSLIYTALCNSPNTAWFVLIDPKRVELAKYRRLPHTMAYACETEDCINALQRVADTMEQRFATMQRNGQTETTEPHIYVFVDEFAPLIISAKKRIEPLFMRISMLGRAAHIHLILCTQRPTRDIITGAVKVNIDARIALRCPTAQDSRNIIGTGEAATLPRYGQAYYLTPQTMQPELLQIMQIDPAEINRVVEVWSCQKPAFRFRAKNAAKQVPSALFNAYISK